MGGLDVGWLYSVYRVSQHLRTRKAASETKEIHVTVMQVNGGKRMSVERIQSCSRAFAVL